MKIQMTPSGIEPAEAKPTALPHTPLTPWCDLKSVEHGENLGTCIK